MGYGVFPDLVSKPDKRETVEKILTQMSSKGSYPDWEKHPSLNEVRCGENLTTPTSISEATTSMSKEKLWTLRGKQIICDTDLVLKGWRWLAYTQVYSFLSENYEDISVRIAINDIGFALKMLETRDSINHFDKANAILKESIQKLLDLGYIRLNMAQDKDSNNINQNVNINIPNDRGKFYVVFRGFHTGIYLSWEEAKAQVSGFPNNMHKRYTSLQEAEQRLRQYQVDPANFRL